MVRRGAEQRAHRFEMQDREAAAQIEFAIACRDRLATQALGDEMRDIGNGDRQRIEQRCFSGIRHHAAGTELRAGALAMAAREVASEFSVRYAELACDEIKELDARLTCFVS